MIKRRSKKRMIKSTLFGFIFPIVCLCIIHKVTLSAYTYTENVVESESARVASPDILKTTLSVTSHSTLDEIAGSLYADGLISDPKYFKLEANLEFNNKKLIPGNYSLNSSMSVPYMLTLMTTNPVPNETTTRITIPEGYTINNIADYLNSKDIISAEDFLLAATTLNFDANYSFLQSIPDNLDYKYKLEGYLAPGTYTINKNASAEEIIILMLDHFEEIISRYSTYINGSHYSIHELITMASIIEREASLEEERPLIAGVIYNRLSADMNLELASPIQYILNKRRSNLSLVDIKKDNAYNTYLYKGLPAGPICNPSEGSLKAVLFPLNHDYFYFVADNRQSGSHYFSSSYSEHDYAKHLYSQLNDLNFTD